MLPGEAYLGKRGGRGLLKQSDEARNPIKTCGDVCESVRPGGRFSFSVGKTKRPPAAGVSGRSAALDRALHLRLFVFAVADSAGGGLGGVLVEPGLLVSVLDEQHLDLAQ